MRSSLQCAQDSVWRLKMSSASWLLPPCWFAWWIFMAEAQRKKRALELASQEGCRGYSSPCFSLMKAKHPPPVLFLLRWGLFHKKCGRCHILQIHTWVLTVLCAFHTMSSPEQPLKREDLDWPKRVGGKAQLSPASCRSGQNSWKCFISENKNQFSGPEDNVVFTDMPFFFRHNSPWYC